MSRSHEEAGGNCPGSKPYPKPPSPLALSLLFLPGNGGGIFHQKALHTLSRRCLNSASHCSASICFPNGRSKSQHENTEKFRKTAHSQQYLLQRGELTWPGSAATSGPAPPVQPSTGPGNWHPLEQRPAWGAARWEGENLTVRIFFPWDTIQGRGSAAKSLFSDGPAAFLKNLYIPKDLLSLLLVF